MHFCGGSDQPTGPDGLPLYWPASSPIAERTALNGWSRDEIEDTYGARAELMYVSWANEEASRLDERPEDLTIHLHWPDGSGSAWPPVYGE